MPTPSFHAPFIKANLPGWIKHLAAPDIQALHRARDPVQQFKQAFPEKFAAASLQLRQALTDSVARRKASSEALAKTLKDFKGITEFGEPLLLEALRKQFALAPDVNKTMIYHLRARQRADKQTLLQAALRNFEADESFDDVVGGETSALAPTGSLEEVFSSDEKYSRLSVRYHLRDKLAIKPGAFANLCRQLDLGAQYQAHLSAVYETPATAAQVRQQTIDTNKDTLRVQAHIARMHAAISEETHTTLLAILDGSPAPMLYGWPVAYSQLNLLGSDVSDVVIISTAARKRQVNTAFGPPRAREYESLLVQSRVIVCIPGDPLEPVKEYRSLGVFLTQLAVKLRSPDYQRFFSGLLPQDEAPRFMARLKPQMQVLKWNPDARPPNSNVNPGAFRNGIYESVWNDNVKLHAKESFIDAEVFGHLYEKHLARVKYNAKLLAVPTAQVDHDAWISRLKHWAEWGLNVLNVAAFFVPGLGEVMMVVTAVQLGYEVYQGIEAWSVGDSDEAWAHLFSIMQNVAFMAVLGAVAGKAPAILPSRFVNGMSRVKSPFGKLRLWHPDLAAYKSSVSLKGLTPNKLGQYELARKTYIALDGNTYETIFDPAANHWRIKHPYAIDTYEPILRHNGHGAWRHTLERPLQWDRATLLKRLGHATEGLDDAAVENAVKVSGVDDAELRRMHTDSLPMPSALVDTLRQFKVDRQLTDMLEQVRLGTPVPDNRYNYTLPEVINMPRWPLGRVIDVFDDASFAGPSTRYGQTSTPPKPVIKLSRGDVSSGRLAERVLANLEEEEIISLLGAQGARVATEREAVFRQQLADHLTANSASLFDSMLEGERLSAPQTADTQALQRVFPSLPTEAAYEVLAEATPAEQLQMARPATPPAALLLKARTRARLARLNRALTGLHLPSAMSSDSQRLALHTLEKLPGWPQDVRLEVRQGHRRGRLLDSIGSESAAEVKYLVVKDTYHQYGSQQFQAFDQQDNALNSVPVQGDNFFASIMHALPDHARTRLGVPQVGQTAVLEGLVRDYATANRELMMQALVPEWKPSRSKARTFMKDRQIGYPLSGEGSSAQDMANESLAVRVRDVYSNLTDAQALEFVQVRRNAGSTPQQIYHLLESRGREFEGLRSALATWVQGGAPAPQLPFGPGRQNFMDRIITSWRAGMNRDLGEIEWMWWLDLRGAGPLPTIAGDFSHVRTLEIDSSQINDGALWQAFSHLKGLRISVYSADIPALAGELAGWNSITELHLVLPQDVGASPALTQTLLGMTQLESLSFAGRPPVLDYSAFTRLRTLALSGVQGEWPTGILTLESLESLDLTGLELRTLPDALFDGHEALWRRLGVNWGALERESFMRAFDYVYENPAHLVNEPVMVEVYCRARLQEMLPQQDYGAANRAVAALTREGLAGRALLEAVEAVQDEYRTLNATLEQWQGREGALVEGERMSLSSRTVLANRIRTCWRNALADRYAPEESVTASFPARDQRAVETLSFDEGAPGDLPALGNAVFPHIRRLNLSGARLTATQLDDFLGHFSQLNELNLSGNRLTELPSSIEAVGQLTELNLSDNVLTITATTQARLNRLTSVQRLDLSRNRVGRLDVSSLSDLVSLDLSSTQISAWPEGVLTLPRLGFLNMSASAITDIPVAALTGHEVLLAGTSLRACRLSPEGMARVQAFARSTQPGTPYATMFSRPLGIDRAVLAEGRTGGDPMFFPVEVSERPDLLLPLPLTTASTRASLTSAERLHRLDSQLSVGQARTRIDAWLAQDVGAAQIEKTLQQWEEQHSQLIQRFNSWIDVPATRNRDEWVNATDRRRAADRLLACWRETLREAPGQEGAGSDYHVDLSGLILGDLPDLPVTFSHVGGLDLSGVRLTTASQQFLGAFPRLNSLNLNGNRLGVLPDNIMNRAELTHLMLNDNALWDSETLQNQLRTLPRLQSLDLGRNHLGTFDMTGLDHLQRLDLSDSGLSQWPGGVLQAPALTSLALRNNQIETIPLNALEPEHAALMAGVDLSDNLLLHEECIRLREYLRRTGRGLGFTAEEIDRVIAGYGDEPFEEEGADVHPELEPAQQQKDRWFEGVPADSEKHRMWDIVMADDSTGDFAFIVSQLRNTGDFSRSRSRLAARVWAVLEAASADEALRERLMGIARASRHTATCGDGRILLFNALEVEVYEFNALKDIQPSQRGRALLKLSRSLFRLAQLETIAGERIRRNPWIDPAEIRLAYRVELATRLGLPPQPENMLYRPLAGLTQADLDAACARVLEQEQTPAFVEQLTARRPWKDYLQEKYPHEFAEVQKTLDDKVEQLDETFPEMNPAYLERYNALSDAHKIELEALVNRLSEQEIAALAD